MLQTHMSVVDTNLPFCMMVGNDMGIQNQSYWKSDLTSVTFDLNF